MNTPSHSSSAYEFSVVSIGLGLFLSVVMGAANVYLGLKAGMTVSASIPAAVISMGILRLVFRRSSILESNLVQTSASAGESLAAGVIFTMPALLIAGIWSHFDYWTTTVICLSGGLLGVLFMIPMRKVFVVEARELTFPEGVACAEILQTGSAQGESAASHIKLLLQAVILGGVLEFAKKFLGLVAGSVEWARYAGQKVLVFGSDVSPALIGVGYIVGFAVALQVFIGGALGWLVAIPLLGQASTDQPAIDAAYEIWSTQIRYIGVGAMIVGGLHSIVKIRLGMVDAVKEMIRQVQVNPSIKQDDIPETERNLSSRWIIALGAFTIVLVVLAYYSLLDRHLVIALVTTAIMLVAAFFFTAVSSYIVGLVGNSNNPVSGMTITVVLFTGLVLHLFGFAGRDAILAVLGVAGVVCCVCCTSGDVCNDLKTGHLVGASPRRQQIMQVLGVVVASLVMAPVMIAIHEGSIAAGGMGIGGKDLPAPQAGLFASLAMGFFGDKVLPWNLIFVGSILALFILSADRLLQRFKPSSPRLYIMPIAVGIYLPLGLSVPIMLGGVIHYWIAKAKGEQAFGLRKGTLLASGLIAGESLLGVGLAVLAYFGITGHNLSPFIGGHLGTQLLGIAVIGLVCAWLYQRSSQAD